MTSGVFCRGRERWRGCLSDGGDESMGAEGHGGSESTDTMSNCEEQSVVCRGRWGMEWHGERQ